MSYNAKRWVDPVTLRASDLNELEFGVQEAHENLDILNKEVTNITQDQDMMIKKLNDLTSGSSDAFAIIKDIESLLQEDKDLADILKVNSENYLSKGTQYLTYLEKQKVLTNLGLDKYKFLETITINGEQVLTDSLHINIPEIDNQLDRNSTNAVANNAIVKALENLGTPDLSRYMNIHNESSTAHSDIRSELNTKATYTYVQNMLSQIPTPDVSGQISGHNLSDTAHQDIRNLIKNIDLSGYSLKDHNHDSVYAPIQHTHPYAAEDHTHNYATPEYVDNKVSSIDIRTEINSHNSDASAHPEIQNAIKNIDLSGYSKEGHTHDDYLPLTAGVDKKVTGSFHVDNYITIANGKGYRAYDSNGTIKELLRLSTGDTIILGDANSNLDIATHGTVRPSADKLLNLGTATYPWTNIYGTTIYQNGKQVANKEDIPDISNIDLSGYSKIGHKHDDAYAPITHSHDYATPSYVDTAIANLVGAAPDALNTFEELAAALNNNKDILSTFLTKNNPSGTGSLSLNRKANTTIGTTSVALGMRAQATGNYSYAEGYESTAQGSGSHAEGYRSIAQGDYSHAEGRCTEAIGNYSHAEGDLSQAFGTRSHAEGCSIAIGDNSHAESYSIATGYHAHAEGGDLFASYLFPFKVNISGLKYALTEEAKNNSDMLNSFNNLKRGMVVYHTYPPTGKTIFLTVSEVNYEAYYFLISSSSGWTYNNMEVSIAIGSVAGGHSSHAEGISSIANGEGSHAEGYYTFADGAYSHSEGAGTTATHMAQHVIGTYNALDNSTEYSDERGNYIEIVGNGTSDTDRANARTLDWNGNEWLAGGLTTVGTITEAGTLLSDKYASKNHNHDSVYLSKTTGGTVNGPVSFTGTVGNTQTTSGIYLGLDQNTGAENANMAIVSANTAAYIDMGRPNVDYDFRIIKWNNSGNTNAQLVYGGNAYGTITIPQADGTMALAENVPNIYKGTSSTQSSNTTSVKTLRLGLVGSTLYIWTS